MTANVGILNCEGAEATQQAQQHRGSYMSSQEMRLKAEAELEYTKRRLQTLSRLYEQSCKEIFNLRQQLSDTQRAMAQLRASIS